MKKEELRIQFRAQRKLLSPNELSTGSAAIIERTLSSFQLSGKTVSLFLPIERQNEINTYGMWEKIVAIDGFVAVPIEERRLAEQLDVFENAVREQADLQAARRAASDLKQAYAQLETALRGQAERSTGT